MIETERLVLRRWEKRDRGPFAALNADPEVMRFLGPGFPLTREESDGLVDRIEAGFEEHGFGLWCVGLRDDPTVCIGFSGLAVPTWLPEILPAVEIGWRLDRAHWGRGLATEGSLAAAAYAFDEAGLDRLVSMRHPENDRSRRVMEKLGLVYQRDTIAPASGVPCSIHTLTVRQWRDRVAGLRP
jgi:RimJ/RimL family protein N-acetyltransferase